MLFPEPSWNLPWNPKEWLLNSLFPLEMAVCGGPWRICMGVDEQSVGCDCGLDWPSAPILTHCAWSILEYFPIHTILGICLPVFSCMHLGDILWGFGLWLGHSGSSLCLILLPPESAWGLHFQPESAGQNPGRDLYGTSAPGRWYDSPRILPWTFAQ